MSWHCLSRFEAWPNSHQSIIFSWSVCPQATYVFTSVVCIFLDILAFVCSRGRYNTTLWWGILKVAMKSALQRYVEITRVYFHRKIRPRTHFHNYFNHSEIIFNRLCLSFEYKLFDICSSFREIAKRRIQNETRLKYLKEDSSCGCFINR